ncbi:Protein PAT1-like protein 1 [Aphelenchoides fujianensis]|nr:Protein PAT1-like protein 1 [Aphelenchoides fujianensis]
MFSHNSTSPELQPFFADDDGGDLQPFEFDDEVAANEAGGSGRIPGEEAYDAINDETFGNCEPLGADGLEGLAERTKLLELKDEGNLQDFSWPLPESIPVPASAENGARRHDDTSSFVDWLANADLQPSSSKLDQTDYNSFLFNAKQFEPCLTFNSKPPAAQDANRWAPPPSLPPMPRAEVLQPPPGLPPQPKMLTEEMILRMAEEQDRSRQKEQRPPAFPPMGYAEHSDPSRFNDHFHRQQGRGNRPEDSFAHSQSGVHRNDFPPPSPAFNAAQQSKPPYGMPPGMRPPSGQLPRPTTNRPPADYQRFMAQLQQQAKYIAYQQQMAPPQSPMSPMHGRPAHSQQPMGGGGPKMPPMPNGAGMNSSVRNLMSAFQQQQQQPPPNFWPSLPPPGSSAYDELMMNAMASMQGGRMPPPAFNPAAQHQMMGHSMRGSNNSLASSRMSKRPGLPSTKTISDFAFDPYAGLMSKKEREWLIKIQLIQCMVTGDPMDDDYYYTLWKQRNELAKTPAEWIVTMKPKYYNFDNTYPSDRYVPPVFSGSLGRPTHSSTAQPRQIINLHTDSVDDDESTAGKASSQRRLRAILLRIENASLALLECRDFLYKAGKRIEVLDTNRALEIVHQRHKNIIDSVATVDELPTFMLVQKGRFLIGQLILYVDDAQSSGIMETLIRTAPKYSRRIPQETNNQPLMRAIVTKLRNMDLSAFKHLRETLPMVLLESLLPTSTFAQQLCLSFMIGLCGRDIPPAEVATGPIGEWLADTNGARLPALFAVFNQEAVDFDLLQLYKGLYCFPPGSIGLQLAELLKARIKQRPS